MVRKIFTGLLVVALIVGAAWAYQSWHVLQVQAKTTKFNSDVDDLFDALQKYKEKVGSYPVGNNAEVVQALQGKNPKNVFIVVGRKMVINTKGEIMDPWGTPLRIYFSGEGVLVRSAGPNKRFDDSTVLNSDDYYRSN